MRISNWIILLLLGALLSLTGCGGSNSGGGAYAGVYQADVTANSLVYRLTLFVDTNGNSTISLIDESTGLLKATGDYYGSGTVSSTGTLSIGAQRYTDNTSINLSGTIASSVFTGSITGNYSVSPLTANLVNPTTIPFTGSYSGNGTYKLANNTTGATTFTVTFASSTVVTISGSANVAGVSTAFSLSGNINGGGLVTAFGVFGTNQVTANVSVLTLSADKTKLYGSFFLTDSNTGSNVVGLGVSNS